MIPKLALACMMLVYLGAAPAAEAPAYGAAVTLDQAKRIAAGALAEAARNKWRVAVAIVDTHGFLKYYEMLDDTQTASAAIAVEKARTAAMFRRPSKAFEDGIVGGRAALLGLPGVTPIDGGLPIVIDGRIVGAIGVSGVNSARMLKWPKQDWTPSGRPGRRSTLLLARRICGTPQVPAGRGSPGTQGTSGISQLPGGWLVWQPLLTDPPPFPDAEIIDRENIGSAERGHQHHLDRPPADATNGNQSIDQHFVVESRGFHPGWDDAGTIAANAIARMAAILAPENPTARSKLDSLASTLSGAGKAVPV